jgi:photosystem II stability/assembly factor-like uncharacterized protein
MSQRRLFVGMESGTLVVDDDDGWVVERQTLQEKNVNTLMAPPGLGATFAAVNGDGVYRSRDGGRTWDLVFSADVRSLAFDPSRPACIYAGTEPARLFRSDDAGGHWAEIEGLQLMPESVKDRWWFPQPPHESHVLSICVDPEDSRVICLGLEHGGILRTEDGGENWEDLSAGIEYLDIHVVAVDPSRQNLCYASTARGFYRSEDFGRNWVISESGFTRDYFHDMIVRPGPSSTLYLATANGIPPTWLRSGRAQSAIYRSSDAGQSWQQLGGGLPEAMERMPWGLVGDPSAEDRVYAGFGDYNLPADQRPGGEVWLSEDRGGSWTRIGETPSPVRALTVAVN